VADAADPLDGAPPDGSAPDGGGVVDAGAQPDAAPDAAPDLGPTSVSLVFPPPRSVSDQPAIVVRGKAMDPDGVAAVRVNGVLATTTNSFTDWRATVPLAAGANPLVIETEDRGGRVAANPPSATVLRRPLQYLHRPRELAVDLPHDRLLVVTESGDIVGIDRVTGRRARVSGNGTGGGPLFDQPQAIAVDAPRGRALVLDGRRVLAVDLASGDRSIVSDGTTGSGPVLQGPVGMAIDAATSTLLVMDTAGASLVAVDLATGARQIASGATRGGGPALTAATAVAIDPVGRRAFVTGAGVVVGGRFVVSLLAIDLATGQRSVVSDPLAGDGPQISGLFAIRTIAYDGARDRVLVAANDAVLEVDVAGGARSAVANLRLALTTDVAIDPVHRVAYATDLALSAVATLDLASGATDFLVDPDFGLGFPVVAPAGLALDADSKLWLVNTVSFEGAVLALDRNSQRRTLLTPRSAGLAFVHDLAFDPATASFLVTDSQGNRVVRVDPGTGALNDVVTGLRTPGAIVVDTIGHRAFVASEQRRIYQVDLETGESSVWFDGVTFSSGGDLALDRAHNRLLYTDDQLPRILAIDLTTRAAAQLATGGRALALSRAGKLLVGRPDELAVYDLDTHTETTVASPTLGAGPRLSPASIVEDLEGRAFVTSPFDDRGAGGAAVFAVDLVTGDRVVVSAH